MDDKELIEKAADAAGYEYFSSDDGESIYLVWGLPNGEAGRKLWDPLEDDGDAFRLMADCNLTACTDGEKTVSASEAWSPRGAFITQSVKGCKHAATRRAIVRAAAAMGDES